MQNANVHTLEWKSEIPDRMNCPFYYQPHPVCLAAVEEVKKSIAAMTDWHDEIAAGKMFGVLVVRDDSGSVLGSEGALGFLQAYSGQIAGREDWPGWVPAVFDYLQPDGYFVSHELEISDINTRINDMQKSDRFRMQCARLAAAKEQQREQIENYRQYMSCEKACRERRRQEGEEPSVLIRESQFQKAEFKRLKQRTETELLPLQNAVADYENELLRLKKQRQRMSDSLQQWLFSQFVMLNGLGESADLLEIFKHTPPGVPPSGAGECCAPKLLQYAFANSLHPVAIAEFWWGQSPVGEIRQHLAFYPACQGKCKPILDFMLKGVDVEPNPLEKECAFEKLKVVYIDDSFVVVNKPAGLLSVPGKVSAANAQDVLSRQINRNLFPVHRLDMQTSGLLMFALSEEVQLVMQKKFASRQVKKKYVAVLDGVYAGPCDGTISLPLSPDYINRPCQRVDYEKGKESVTIYNIMYVREGRTYINLYPQTGRTHQLRVHCAYKDGLGVPIVGDDLYGKHAERLLLHAETLDFVHPVTEKQMHIECKHDF